MNTLMLIIALVEWRAAGKTSLLDKVACIASFFLKRLNSWRRVLALVALSVPERPPPDNYLKACQVLKT